MAQAAVFQGDVQVQGTLNAGAITLPSNCVGNSQVQTPAAGSGIDATKLIHDERRMLAQASNTTVSNITQVVHVVIGTAATVLTFEAGAVVPAVGADTATVDLKKNGTTVLGSVITLSSAQSARQVVTGSISVASAVAGDVFEITITAVHSSGTLAQGVFAVMQIKESTL